MNAEVSSARSVRLFECSSTNTRARRLAIRCARAGSSSEYDTTKASRRRDSPAPATGSGTLISIVRRSCPIWASFGADEAQLLLLHDAVEDRYAQELLGNGPQAFLVVEGRRGIDEIWRDHRRRDAERRARSIFLRQIAHERQPHEHGRHSGLISHHLRRWNTER